MLKRFGIILQCLLLLIITACEKPMPKGKLTKVGLLVSETINDQVWGTKGYKGILKIQSRFNVDVFYKEDMDSKMKVERAVKEFDQKGVNLVFGHGSEYADYFNAIADQYPDIHFVSFNGEAKKTNTTSLNFEAYAMGYFGGMIAGHMTKTNNIGIIGAYEWQPEIEGFYEGAQFENPNANVNIQYVDHWDDDARALKILNNMIKRKVDVVYPAGDGYNVPVIEKLKEEGLFAVGFISDQSDLGENTVLTSTIQNVDILYELIAEKYNAGELKSGSISFDFQDGVISLGKFSPLIDKEFIQQINHYIDKYKETGKLPNEL
ncbi:BMP family ABC transporter substrate-binding protein [Bacillus massilinigeriensis]|uniref:BMP family ABC transporter substrate-binding protein n=1 Tax=Bacillus massilionigeriensis TaxID=1805475 RepID=UPI00096B642D|nr:BMP family ABC transporter substrate-binding protein [Bacillus massilionigeriensis]